MTNYSARSAALRALKKAGLDPKDYDISRDASSRWSWKANPDAAKDFPPANATRRAELETARKEKTARSVGVIKTNDKGLGKRTQAIADAQAGKLPAPPDFSAETHTRFRPKLAELVALVKAKDIKALKAYPIKPISTSPKALDRYRNLAVMALEAKAHV